MTVAILLALGLILTALVTAVTALQLLYLESMRLRTREYAALQYFKETLEEKIGLKGEQGLITFSLVKHTGIVLVGMLFLAASYSQRLGWWEAVGAACLLSGIAVMVSCYIVPQLLYRKSSGSWMMALLPVYLALAIAARPFTWVLGFFTSLFELGNGKDEREEPMAGSAEHVEALIDAGTEEGILEEGDRKLIQSVVAFGDKTVREVMTPRPRIVGIQQDKTAEDLRQLVISEQYSRIPVYEESIDQVVGFVHVRDMFEMDYKERAERKVRELMREIRMVPETKRVSDLMREMQQDGTHMAIVVDEYGSTAGLVTLEDMVEEIVGDIKDEHEPESDFREEPDGSYIVSGSFDLGRLGELIGFRPEHDTESTTVAGLVTEWLGHVPAVGETAQRDGITIQVLAASDLRVDQVRVARAAVGDE